MKRPVEAERDGRHGLDFRTVASYVNPQLLTVVAGVALLLDRRWPNQFTAAFFIAAVAVWFCGLVVAIIGWKGNPQGRAFEVKQIPGTTPGAEEKDIDHG